ncbi:MAG TPA: ABC transporter permease [Bacteroidia bacterium]|nr:ABC transporter permease [Bacteroidia bacterium]
MDSKQISEGENWDIVIRAEKSPFALRLQEIWRYRDLLTLFVKRDFVATYKQTVLGPLWFFLQPVLTAIVYSVVFGFIARLSTSGYPRILFYLSGIIGWSYFADCLTKTSATFLTNQNLFGKVYFPRIILPLSVVTTNMIRFVIQLTVLAIFIVYYNITGLKIIPNEYALLLPFLLVLMACMGLGFGTLISSVTTKYRDFQFLVAFGVTLLMYFSPVLFPLDSPQVQNNETFRTILLLNPMSAIIETMRFGLLGKEGNFELWGLLGYSIAFTIVLLIIGLYMFNRVQRTFTDTV